MRYYLEVLAKSPNYNFLNFLKNFAVITTIVGVLADRKPHFNCQLPCYSCNQRLVLLMCRIEVYSTCIFYTPFGTWYIGFVYLF